MIIETTFYHEIILTTETFYNSREGINKGVYGKNYYLHLTNSYIYFTLLFFKNVFLVKNI